LALKVFMRVFRGQGDPAQVKRLASARGYILRFRSVAGAATLGVAAPAGGLSGFAGWQPGGVLPWPFFRESLQVYMAARPDSIGLHRAEPPMYSRVYPRYCG
jgi:hypothetical protein